MKFSNGSGFTLLLISCFVFISSIKGMELGEQNAPFSPVDLKCEFRINPLGVDIFTPRLEWILAPVNSQLRALSQTAYQVLVASSTDLLNQDKGDVWNSHKIICNEMKGIFYAGLVLKSHQRVWWKVRVWGHA